MNSWGYLLLLLLDELLLLLLELFELLGLLPPLLLVDLPPRHRAGADLALCLFFVVFLLDDDDVRCFRSIEEEVRR